MKWPVERVLLPEHTHLYTESGSTVTTDPTTEGTGPHGPLAHTYCLCSDPQTALVNVHVTDWHV
jgi:hypothetical protein